MCADPCTKQKRATRIIEQKKKKNKNRTTFKLFPFSLGLSNDCRHPARSEKSLPLSIDHQHKTQVQQRAKACRQHQKT